MKYKVDDKVRIRKDLYFGGNYGIACNNDMPHYAGVETVITHITKFGNYALLADKGANYWSADMLEPAEEQELKLVLPEWARWVTKDAFGRLFVHEEKPFKNIYCGAWYPPAGKESARLRGEGWETYLWDITWEQEEPAPIGQREDVIYYGQGYYPKFMRAAIKTPDDSPDDAPLAVVEGPEDTNRSIYTPVTQTPDPKIALHKQITEELTAIYEAKNHDYGDSFQETYRKLGLISAVTRISDKVNRLQSLSKKDQLVADESIRDTLVDCANYCIMTIIALEETE